MRQTLVSAALLAPGLAAAGTPASLASFGFSNLAREAMFRPAAGLRPLLRPQAETTVLPEYPPAAERGRFDGRVLLTATIDREGRVVNLRRLEEGGDPAGFADAAMRAIALWTYRPAVGLDGRPMEVPVLFDVRFTP